MRTPHTQWACTRHTAHKGPHRRHAHTRRSAHVHRQPSHTHPPAPPCRWSGAPAPAARMACSAPRSTLPPSHAHLHAHTNSLPAAALQVVRRSNSSRQDNALLAGVGQGLMSAITQGGESILRLVRACVRACAWLHVHVCVFMHARTCMHVHVLRAGRYADNPHARFACTSGECRAPIPARRSTQCRCCAPAAKPP